MDVGNFWHPFRWPGVKVTKLPKRAQFKFWRNSTKIVLAIFFCKILNPFSPVEHSICHFLGMVGPIDVKQKGNESIGCYADWGTFDFGRWPWPLTCADWSTFDLYLWPWIFKVKFISGMGGPIVMERMGWADSMPWCKIQPICDVTSRQRILLGTGVT